MELNITRFFNEAGMMDYSASIAEIGKNAARETWQAALDDAAEYSILPDDAAREAFRDHVRGFGAWEDDEINAWDEQHCNALMMQMVAGDVREAESVTGLERDDPAFWPAYEKESAAGGTGGRMGRGDDGQVYYYLGD